MQPEAMWMSVGHAVAWTHADVSELHCHLEAMLMSVVQAAPKDPVWVHGCTAAWGHVHGLCSH